MAKKGNSSLLKLLGSGMARDAGNKLNDRQKQLKEQEKKAMEGTKKKKKAKK